MTVEDRVKAILADHLSALPGDLAPGAKLRDDLGADDVTIGEIVMALREEFGLEMSVDDAQGLATVGAVVAFVTERSA